MIPFCTPPQVVVSETGEPAMVPWDAEGLITPLERYGIGGFRVVRSRYAISGNQVGTLSEENGSVSFSPVFSLPKKVGQVAAFFNLDPYNSGPDAELVVLGESRYFEFDVTGRLHRSTRLKGRYPLWALQDGGTIVISSRGRRGQLIQAQRWNLHLRGRGLVFGSPVVGARNQWIVAGGAIPQALDLETRGFLPLGTIMSGGRFAREDIVGLCGSWLVSETGKLFAPSLYYGAQTPVAQLKYFYAEDQTCRSSRPRSPYPWHDVACAYVSQEGVVVVDFEGTETLIPGPAKVE